VWRRIEEPGAAGASEVAADADALLELLEGLGGGNAFDLDPVFARVGLCRVEQACGPEGFVGQQKKPFGVSIQAANGIDAGWEAKFGQGALAGVIRSELGQDAVGLVEGQQHGRCKAWGVDLGRGADWQLVEPGQVAEGFVEPLGVWKGVGPEGLDPSFVAVEEEGAVEAEVVGLGRVDEAGGIVGAHLEQDAKFELGEGLAAELAEQVGVGVTGDEEMETEVCALGDQPVQDEPGMGEGGLVILGEGGVFVVAELFVVLEAVDKEEQFGGVGGKGFAASLVFVEEFLEDYFGVSGLDPADGVGQAWEDLLEEFGVGGVGRAAIEEVELGGLPGKLGPEDDRGQQEQG